MFAPSSTSPSSQFAVYDVPSSSTACCSHGAASCLYQGDHGSVSSSVHGVQSMEPYHTPGMMGQCHQQHQVEPCKSTEMLSTRLMGTRATHAPGAWIYSDKKPPTSTSVPNIATRTKRSVEENPHQAAMTTVTLPPAYTAKASSTAANHKTYFQRLMDQFYQR